MNPVKAAALLNARVQSFSTYTGGDRLNSQDIAHAQGKMWHPGARLFGRVKWADQEEYQEKLLKLLIAEVEKLSAELKWRAWEGEIERVCKLALYESLTPKLCSTCRGLGEFVIYSGKRGRPKRGAKPDLKVVCEDCAGTGIRSFADYKRSTWTKISRSRWRNVWSQRYKENIQPITDKMETLYWSMMRRLLDG